ncbi:PREDICTED: UDP-glycosyltransferase 71C2-like [Brassica oleracea var. oleracea]|uniref:Glycosyltransferase n=1 Tax=Brassica oleracea var. oleracea TaxID=109376 RepID=A0A0D3BTR4_BRAOL|nr:PREDICTED: UDP-glycosyltransferase 71C2-like [Brassica oleracea var. oleracea]
MEKQEAELIFIPFPITGHLLATIELVKIILSHDPRRINTITILNWGLPFLPQSNNDASLQSLAKSEPRVRIVALPELANPPPMEFFVRAPEAYLLEFVKRMVPLVRDAVSTLLSSSRDGSDSVRVVGIVLDMFCVPLMDVGNELCLPSYIFLTCSAGFLSLAKHIPERHLRVKSGFDRSSGEEENTVPGYVASVPTKVLPLGLLTSESYDAWVDMTGRFHEAKGILVNSSIAIEPNAFGYFDRIPVNEYPPVYPVGPILCFNDRPILDPLERDRVMTWLDEQPESSVVFLCFGSLKNLAATQVKEIAQALEIVGCRFLWSIRTDPKEYPNPFEILPDGFMNRVSGLGFVCGWAPQVEILAHKAIGGFVSHCGWNSILESLRFGVPIATWPMYAEQQLNAFTMVKELGLALEMRLDYVLADGEIVKADEIARAVRSLMEGEDVPRGKLKEIAEAAKEAMMDGGSSFVAIERFIDEVVVSAMDCSKSREY